MFVLEGWPILHFLPKAPESFFLSKIEFNVADNPRESYRRLDWITPMVELKDADGLV